MNKTMCPGQDTRYWRPDDIFTVVCFTCGNAMEFFKDDAKRRCRRCGTIVQNPRLSRGCAQWCKHAKECLGYDPADTPARDTSAVKSMADSIIDSISNEFGTDSEPLLEALKALERADMLLEDNASNPRVTIPAVLLLNVDMSKTAPIQGIKEPALNVANQFPVANKILEASVADRDVIGEIMRIIQAYHEGRAIDSPEYRTVAGTRDSP